MDNLQNKQMRTLREGGGQRIGRGRWWYPADSSNYTPASRTHRDIDHIVIHTAEGYTGGLNTFRNPDRNASAHYAVGWDGTVVQMVLDRHKAWHAGTSDMNNRSIGIEHVGFAHAMQPGTRTEWSPRLIDASAKLVAQLARKYKIPITRERIIAHAQVTPDRRTDPGPHWPWEKYLRKARWYYYRPYVFGAVGAVALFGALVAWRRRSERRRIQSWERIR